MSERASSSDGDGNNDRRDGDPGAGNGAGGDKPRGRGRPRGSRNKRAGSNGGSGGGTPKRRAPQRINKPGGSRPAAHGNNGDDDGGDAGSGARIDGGGGAGGPAGTDDRRIDALLDGLGTGTEEGADGFNEVSPGPVSASDLEGFAKLKGPQLKLALSATFLTACGMLSSMPGFKPLQLSVSEANSLGDAWATYILSFPPGKRKAAMATVQKIFPGIVAFGTTAMVFAPRVQLIVSQRAMQPEPARKTPAPSVFERTFGRRAAPQPVAPETTEGELDMRLNLGDELSAPDPDRPLTPQQRAQRNAILNDIDVDIP